MNFNPEFASPEEGQSANDAFDTSAATLQATRQHVFEGDSGELPLDTRRAFVQLLTGPLVDGRRHTKAWEVVLRDEQVLRSRLHELFLELVLDRDQQVAFLRQIVREDVDIPILLRRNTLSFIETALLLFLRLRLTQAESQGERAVVDLVAMLEYLKTFERSDNVDQSRFAKQCDGAVEKVKKLSLIRKLANSEDRFEVSPALKLLFPAEEIAQLTKSYAAAKLSLSPDAATDDGTAIEDENDESWSQS